MNTTLQNTIFSAIVGDWNINIIQTGFSEDVDSLPVGWLYTWKHDDPRENRTNGIVFDSARVLVDVGLSLNVREVEALLEAGFIVDESFYPRG